MRDQADAVLVGVDQVAAVDLDPADHDGRTEIDEPDVGMADAGVQAEELEAQGLDLVEVARAAAGDVADAAELLVDRRGDLAELGTQPGRVVEVLADRDLRAGLRGDVAQVVAQQVDLRLRSARAARPASARSPRSRRSGPGPAAGSGSCAARSPVCRGRTSNSSIALEIVGVLYRRNASSSAALRIGVDMRECPWSR